MKVFISWSGDYSREVAEKLSEWIPSVIQSVETFFSPDDIGKGENWNNVLSKELNDCNFGIICLTPENVSAPWIHFEAGALAKTLNSRLSSVMFGINPSEVKGPLSRFQNTKFEHDDFFKLLQAINAASDRPLRQESLAYTFDALWKLLDNEIGPITKKYEDASKTPTVPSKINDSDAIQEILSIVRKMSNSTHSGEDIEAEDVESLRTIPDKATTRPIVQLKLAITKRFPMEPLSDETKQTLRDILPAHISVNVISSLERGNDFHRTISYRFESSARNVARELSELPDLVVKSAVRYNI